MYSELYQYLLQYKELPVPGIGTFLLQRQPATVDFPNKKIDPPVASFAFADNSHVPSKNFFAWLGAALGISDRDAIFRFNDFAFDMKKQLSAGDTIEWNGVGTINKGMSGAIKFTPAPARPVGKPVHAEKVIREKPEHTVRVGEEHRTATEMTERLTQTTGKRNRWWVWALTIALLAIIFIGWHFSKHGVDTNAVANEAPNQSIEPAATYQLLP